MNNIKSVIAFFVFLASLLSSCNENIKDASDVAILVSPTNSDTIVISSNDKAKYSLELYTSHDYIAKLKIKSFDSYLGEKTLKDTTCNENKISCSFIFTAPEIDRDSLDVTLFFNAWDNEGNTCEVKRKLQIKNKHILINERSGIVLYGEYDNMPNALSFASPTQTFNILTSPDSSKADLCIEADSDFVNVRMRSNTVAKFVRNNSFDYANASSLSVQSVYASSRRSDVIDNLRINDIILVGHGSQAHGVFHINNVVRNGHDSCVQLSYKGIE